MKKTKSTVKEIEYLLYISDDSDKLEYAVQCDPDSSDSVIQVKLGSVAFKGYSEKQKDYESFNVDVIMLLFRKTSYRQSSMEAIISTSTSWPR